MLRSEGPPSVPSFGFSTLSLRIGSSEPQLQHPVSDLLLLDELLYVVKIVA